jgi:AraC-like DNA-binding protein
VGHLSGSALDVQVLWSSQHRWAAGQEYSGPCYAYGLWLMLEGSVQVWSDDHSWQVTQGDVFLWPKDRPRRVVTPEGATWLSLGMAVVTSGKSDVLGLLTLPALKRLAADEFEMLQKWLQDITSIRDTLTRTTPENQRVAKYFEAVNSPSVFPSYDQWVNQIVAERPSFYDVIEEGLARAVFGWIWNLWGGMDLERALHHQSPQWLQNVLLHLRQHPEISVQELGNRSGFSPAQFRRLFQQEMGQSPRQYLQSQRLEYARHLLEDTELPIATVATQTGFASVPHFIQLWKQTNGLPPLQYRLARREGDV